MAIPTARETGSEAEELSRSIAERFGALPFDCERCEEPGVMDTDPWRDWTHFETTPDQLRIEDYLEVQDLRRRSILHIGVGNSGLALRFHERAREIVGTSVIAAEIDKARSLGLANYGAILHNKYTGAATGMADHFDFIVDNNPTTFCCCLSHLARMLEFYADKLGEKGQFVTDRVGLGWVHIPGGNARWSFSFDDLAAAGAAVGLGAWRMDRNIYVLSRAKPRAVPLGARAKWLRRDVKRRISHIWTNSGHHLFLRSA